MLGHPDAVKQVFTGDPDVLHAGEGNQVLKPLLGPRSVLLLDGRDHMTERKTLLPPFHGERMQAYGELITRIAEREVASWPAGEPIAVRPRMQALTLEVIMRAVFGDVATSRMRTRPAADARLDDRPAHDGLRGARRAGPDQHRVQAPARAGRRRC